MTTPPINLSELREAVRQVELGHIDHPIYPIDELLALIDTAEAAIDAAAMPNERDLLTNALAKAMHYRLRQTLNRYEQTP